MATLPDQRRQARRCGECTLCCTVAACPALQKPERVTCRYCTAAGCSIHEHRPDMCREWECAWLRGDLPESLFPFDVHVVFEVLPNVDTVLALCEPGHDEAWDTPEVRAVISDYLRRGVAVVINAGKKKHMVIPNGRTRDDVYNDMVAASRAMGM